MPRSGTGSYTCPDDTVVLVGSDRSWSPLRVAGSSRKSLPTEYTYQLLDSDGAVTVTRTTQGWWSSPAVTCRTESPQVDELGNPIGTFIWTVTGTFKP